MKKFILTSSTYKPRFGGIENSLYHLALVLKDNGFHPIIVCSDLGLDSKERLPEREVIDDVEVRRYKRSGRFSYIIGIYPFLDYLKAKALFRELAKEACIEGIIARSPGVGMAAKLTITSAPLAYVVPGIIKTQNRSQYTHKPRSIKNYIQNIINRVFVIPLLHRLQCSLLQVADATIVLSGNMKSQIRRLCSFDACNLIVARPGVDSKRFSPVKEKVALRESMGWQSDGTYALVVGRIVLAKGFDMVIDAIACVDGNKKLDLVIVGDGPEKLALEQRAKYLGVTDRVHFYGVSEKPEIFYQASDLFIMSSCYEPFGQTIIEAMASALPVIAFRSEPKNGVYTAGDEIIEHKREGLLCQYGVEGLTQALNQFLSFTVNQRSCMGQAGRDKVLMDYTWTGFFQAIQVAMGNMPVNGVRNPNNLA